MLNKTLESSFRKELDAEQNLKSSSFTRNRLLRHMETNSDSQDKPTPKVLEPLKPLQKLASASQTIKKQETSQKIKKELSISRKEYEKINHSETPSEESESSYSSNDDDDEFIRKQVEARIEYRGAEVDDLQPIPSTTLPVVLTKSVSFEIGGISQLEIDPNLLALEEYLSEAKLKAATGEDNLKNVKHLEIIVNTTNNSLGDVGSKLANLEELKLNGSTLSSIRDLGTSLKFIRILWLSRCGIGQLDGISTFSRIKELYLSYNDIEDISDLSGMDELEVLDLEGNNIEDELQLVYLSDCKHLTSLTLSGNPLVMKITGYRTMVKSALPTLEYLDDSPLLEYDVGDRGISPIKNQYPSLEDLENEFRMLKKSIKFTRVESLDETLNDNPLILTISNRLYNPTENNMIRNITTATPRLDGGRPQSASFFRRPSSSSIFRSMSKSRIGLRPSTSKFRPTTSMNRPTTASPARPMTASSDKIKPNIPCSNSTPTEEDDSCSHLTYKAKEIYCGNIVQGLKKKKQQEPMFLARNESTDIDMDILAQIHQHKVQTGNEPSEELEEFLNEVYEGINDEKFFWKCSSSAESFSLDSIPVYEDTFLSETISKNNSELKTRR